MAELVDAPGSGPGGGNPVEVRVLFSAPAFESSSSGIKQQRNQAAAETSSSGNKRHSNQAAARGNASKGFRQKALFCLHIIARASRSGHSDTGDRKADEPSPALIDALQAFFVTKRIHIGDASPPRRVDAA